MGIKNLYKENTKPDANGFQPVWGPPCFGWAWSTHKIMVKIWWEGCVMGNLYGFGPTLKVKVAMG